MVMCLPACRWLARPPPPHRSGHIFHLIRRRGNHGLSGAGWRSPWRCVGGLSASAQLGADTCKLDGSHLHDDRRPGLQQPAASCARETFWQSSLSRTAQLVWPPLKLWPTSQTHNLEPNSTRFASQMMAHPIYSGIEGMMPRMMSHPSKRALVRLLYRSINVVVVTVIAMVLPFFSQIAGLVGALVYYPISELEQ